MKFGGTSVGSPARMKEVTKLVTKSGEPVFVVLSAMSGTTNSLVDISNYLYKKNPDGANDVINQLEHKYLKHVDELYQTDAMKEKTSEFIKSEMNYLRSFTKELFTSFEEKSIIAQGELMSTNMVVNYMQEQGILPEKLVAMHLGSGSSISAIYNGKAMDNTMGYTPLEGVAMSTRSGSMDVAAAMAIKHAMNFKTDEELELYLNKQCGLLGLSGSTDDMREIIQKRDEGDPRATMAHAIFVYRIQSYVGQMAASLGGCDALVFAGTIGERSDEIRRFVTQKLGYLGFKLDNEKNENPVFEGRYALISANDSKPIYVVLTDETDQMIYRAQTVLAAEAE